MTSIVPPTVWLIHFTVVYLLLTMVCAAEAAQRTLFGFAPVQLGVGIATVAAVAVIAVAAWVGYRRSPDTRNGQRGFLAGLTLPLAFLSAIGVLWVAYPAFVLPACAH